jgi:drug/metabolite transporter (DMT)-like permease|tara:strand:+ start:183 stop:1100 length:918 start_codon:yes stop_codon:yes gene_type:complete
MNILSYSSKNKIIVVVLSLISTGSAAIMVSGIKQLSLDLNPFIIAFYRCFFGVLIILPFMFFSNNESWKTKSIKLQFLRGSINVYSMISWFTAIGTLHLEKAAAIGFTTPLFTTLLAVILLGEVIKFHRTTALVVGFIGILVVIRPGFVPIESGTLWLLSAALSFSFVLIIVKKLSENDSSLTTAFYHMLFMTPPTFIIALFFWERISLNHLFVFSIVVIAGFITQLCLTQSLKMSDATFVMPLQFTQLIWLSIIGYTIFAEIPNTWTWAGAFIIFLAVIYITYREAFVKKDKPTSKQIERAILD